MKFKSSPLIFLFFFVAFCCCALPGRAQSNHPLAQARELALQTAQSPSDSIRVLLDVYSLSDQVNRDRVRLQIINLVQHSDNREVISDVIKELASTTDDAGALARLIEISDSLPEGEERKTLQTILNMQQAEAQASTVADSQIQNQLVETMRQNMGFTGDSYKEIQNIYRAMVYLGASSQGPLYFEYIKRLEDLVNQLPEDDYSIKNLFYTTAALFYTRKRDYKKAIYYDKKLIRELDAMKVLYNNDPSKSDELDYFYYVSYRRMLRNYKGLTPEEIEEVYNNCVNLAKSNEKAAEEFGSGGLTNSYYYMATKQYSKAIPELKKALNHEGISDFRRAELLGHLSYAMRQTGDNAGELQALRQYTQMLLKDRVARRNDMYREIELRNSVNKLISDEYMQQQAQRESNRVMRKTAVTLVYVLSLILIFVCAAYFRLRQKVRMLEAGNSKLRRNMEDIFDDGVPKGTRDLRHLNHGLKG